MSLLHKTQVAIRFLAKMSWHLASAYMKWVVGRSAFARYVITKFSCFHRLPIYLSNAAPPRALRAREFRYKGLKCEISAYLLSIFFLADRLAFLVHFLRAPKVVQLSEIDSQ